MTGRREEEVEEGKWTHKQEEVSKTGRDAERKRRWAWKAASQRSYSNNKSIMEV